MKKLLSRVWSWYYNANTLSQFLFVLFVFILPFFGGMALILHGNYVIGPIIMLASVLFSTSDSIMKNQGL